MYHQVFARSTVFVNAADAGATVERARVVQLPLARDSEPMSGALVTMTQKSFGCLGIGLASVVPAVFSAAGRIPGLHPGTAVATAAGCGWAGFVCGPPLIGRLSAWTSLPVALGLLPLLTAFIVVGTRTSRALSDRQPAVVDQHDAAE